MLSIINVITLIFLGSVFLTSVSFVNEENTVKFYFTVFSFLLILLYVIFLKNEKSRNVLKEITSIKVLKGFYTVGVVQSLLGICQYIGWFTTKNHFFNVTGSFDNPAGFSSVLSMLFPIGVVWSLNSKKTERYLLLFSLSIMLFSILLSGSRTGLLAVIAATIFIFTLEFQLVSKIKNSKKARAFVAFFCVLLLIVILGLYKLKPQSANGRLLIWEVSTEMIKDKPLIGFGYNGFKAHYMDYQAKYFKQNPKSEYRQLADNVSHPFNEFIKIIVNYGVLGLLIYLVIILFLFKKIIELKPFKRNLFLGILVSFFAFSFFSYPLHYTPVWFLLIYSALIVVFNETPKMEFYKKTRVIIGAICLGGIIFFSIGMYLELKWKKIATKSLQGQTEQMLPEYEVIYPYLKFNALFLYNYGAEQNFIGEYEKSIKLLDACKKQLNDYDLQMLLADNYYNIGNAKNAIKIYQHAEHMIPCRFLPLYNQFEIYQMENDTVKANAIAKKIINKQVKVKSSMVNLIVTKAENYLNLSKPESRETSEYRGKVYGNEK
ncbi:O-antigen ligase family protein [Bacteroidota bacterium]